MTNSTDCTRRTLIKGVLNVSLLSAIGGSSALSLSACSPKEEDPVSYFDILRRIQKGLKASPDHSSARASTFADDASIQELTNFVRDEIRLVSHEAKRFALGNLQRFGPRAALRAGAATAHEKASILSDMLSQRGYKTKIVLADKIDPSQTSSAFFRDFEQEFSPGFSSEDLERWQTSLGASNTTGDVLDVAQKYDLPALQKDIEQALGDDLTKVLEYRFDNRPVGNTPIVEIEKASGEKVYADPINLNSVVGPLPNSQRITDCPEPKGYFPVKVTLSASTSVRPNTLIDLVSKEWRSDQLAGRQMIIGFKPKQSLREIMASRVGDMRVFTPGLALQDVNGLEDISEKDYGIMGDAISLEGDHISLSKTSGKVLVNGIEIETPQPSGKDKLVKNIEVKPSSSLFPDMTLEVTPYNEKGDIVEGLSPADFNITDEDENVVSLLRKTDTAYRILFLADRSLSMPKPYRYGWDGGGQAMVELAQNVERIAKEQHPKSYVQVVSTMSNLWEALDENIDKHTPNLVIYATDGHLTGKTPTEDKNLAARVQGGPPVIVLSCERPIDEIRKKNTSTPNVFDEMANISGGMVLDALDEDTTALQKSLTDYIRSTKQPAAYLFSYRALKPGTGTRKVSVKIGDITASENYSVNEELSGRSNKLAGLYLTIEMNGHKITHTLAGHDGVLPVSQDDIDCVHGALLGRHMISFEGAAPSTSTILEEIITAKLDLEEFDTAIKNPSGDLASIYDALENGYHMLAGTLASLMGRKVDHSGKNYSFAEQGLKTVLYSVHPIMNSEETIRRMDILPTAKPSVIAKDQRTRQEKAFESSLATALTEASLFTNSTYAVLEGKKLSPIERRFYRSLPLEESEKIRWEYLLEDRLRADYARHPGAFFLSAADGKSPALWSIDKASGEIIGILPDGSGGGFGPALPEEANEAAIRIKKQLAELDQVINAINLLASQISFANPYGGLSLSVVAAYGQQLARLYGAVSLTIILADTGELDDAIRMFFVSMACEITKGIFLHQFSGAGKVASNAVRIFSSAEAIGGIAGANSPTSCPSWSPTVRK